MIVNTTQTSIDISWSLPTENKFCVDHYRVCYKLASTFKGLQFAETCTITTDVAQTITNLEPCARYKIRVAAITAAGLYSIDALVEAHTQNAGKRKSLASFSLYTNVIFSSWSTDWIQSSRHH